MEDLTCPECRHLLEEEDLEKELFCPFCKTNLRNPKYKDFLELLMYNDIIDDIDYFDMNLYSDEIINYERDDFDEPDLDPSRFEKHVDVWDEFEDDIELKEGREHVDISQDAWDIFKDNKAIEEDGESEKTDNASKTEKEKTKKVNKN